jgi:hypothetical protein
MRKFFYLQSPTKIVQPGNYKIIRLMARDRILLDVTPHPTYRRQLTIVPLNKGKFV